MNHLLKWKKVDFNFLRFIKIKLYFNLIDYFNYMLIIMIINFIIIIVIVINLKNFLLN